MQRKKKKEDAALVLGKSGRRRRGHAEEPDRTPIASGAENRSCDTVTLYRLSTRGRVPEENVSVFRTFLFSEGASHVSSILRNMKRQS